MYYFVQDTRMKAGKSAFTLVPEEKELLFRDALS